MFCCKSLETRHGSPLTRPSHFISLKLSVCLLITFLLICSHSVYPCELVIVGYCLDVSTLEDLISFNQIIYPLLANLVSVLCDLSVTFLTTNCSFVLKKMFSLSMPFERSLIKTLSQYLDRLIFSSSHTTVQGLVSYNWGVGWRAD